jgi:hypothetical protein
VIACPELATHRETSQYTAPQHFHCLQEHISQETPQVAAVAHRFCFSSMLSITLIQGRYVHSSMVSITLIQGRYVQRTQCIGSAPYGHGLLFVLLGRIQRVTTVSLMERLTLMRATAYCLRTTLICDVIWVPFKGRSFKRGKFGQPHCL